MTAPQPETHALLSPSSAYRWMACPGSIAMQVIGKYADTSGPSADAGTFQHHVAALCLEQRKPPSDFFGYQETINGVTYTFEHDSDYLFNVQTYVDTVLAYAGEDGELFVEQKLDISWITGEEGAIGTADAVIVRGDEITVIDLKTGRNNVEARDNEQLSLYAAAALHAYENGLLTRKTPPPVVAAVEESFEDFL